MDDLSYVRDIQPACCHVSGHERPQSSRAERAERPLPLRLAMVAGDRTNQSRFSSQFCCQSFDFVLLVTKHHRPLSGLYRLQECVDKLRPRLFPRHNIIRMRNRRRTAYTGIDRNPGRIPLHATGKLLDLR